MKIKKYYKLIRVDYSDSELFMVTNVDSSSGSISFSSISEKDIEYSTNGVDWTTLTITSGSASIPDVLPGTHVYMRGNNTNIGGGGESNHINADFNYSISGNMCSLLDKTNYASMTSLSKNAFRGMFNGSSKLVDASGLNLGNVATVGKNALLYCFNNCSNLTSSPDLSSVTEIGESGMEYMFYMCTNLETTPNLSNVTTVGSSSLHAFCHGCQKLTISPDLSNITVTSGASFQEFVKGCWSMATIIVPDIETWNANDFWDWVAGAGSSASEKQMLFKTQTLMDACPSGDSGYGSYTKVLA